MAYYNEKKVFQVMRTTMIEHDVPTEQATTTIVFNALYNINGVRVNNNYTAFYTTIGDYVCYQIKYNGQILTEQQAIDYMEFMSGSKFLPVYVQNKPQNSIFIFGDLTMWKPQYTQTSGLALYRMKQIASKEYVDAIKKDLQLEINNLKSIVYDTVASVEEYDEDYAGILPNPTSVNSKPVIDETKCQVAKIFGNSVVKNELFNKDNFGNTQTINGVTFTNNGNGTITVNGTATDIADFSLEAITVGGSAYKYLLIGSPQGSTDNNYFLYDAYNGNKANVNGVISSFRGTAGSIPFKIRVLSGVTVNNAVFKPKLISLTQFFGSNDNIPTALLNDPTLWYKYIKDTDCNVGALVDSVVNKIASYSQLWDEQYEVGRYNENGIVTTGNAIRSKNYIPVIPNSTIYLHNGNDTNSRICYFDLKKNFISSEIGANTTFTIPANCKYIMFSTSIDYGTTYNNDISIYYGSTNRGYIPYSKLGEILINQTLKGTLNAHDTLEFVEQENGTFNAVKTSNIGDYIFTGNENWGIAGSGTELRAYINASDISNNIKENSLGICNVVAFGSALSVGQFDLSLTYVRFNIYGIATDRQSFNTWLINNNVVIHYELATPTTEVIATGLTLDEVAFLIKLGGYIEVDSEEVAPNIKLAYIVKDFQE